MWRFCLLVLGGWILWAGSGCQRNRDIQDDRTLQDRPHVETVHPENRADAFRP